MKELYGKNIALISPSYFGYEKSILSGLIEKGANVIFIDDRIKNGTLNKIFFRLKLRQVLKPESLIQYFQSCFQKIQGNVDYVLAIIPEGFSKEVLEYFRLNMKSTIFILYMWDSIDNRPYIIDTLGFYDKTFTFDRANADKYSMKFRPLFYENSFSNIPKMNSKYKYDLSFIGTAHSDRYFLINRIRGLFKGEIKCFFYFYLQSRAVFLYYLIKDKQFKNVRYSDIRYTPVSKADTVRTFSESKCIIDINHPMQTGLTIRTIEALGAKRKLITTNHDVINYDFYDPRNIGVINRENPSIDSSFLQTKYQEIDQDTYNRYSLSSWIDDIFS